MRCPACKLPLVTLEVQGVELDYCGVDLGVWFDAGEIEALFQSAAPMLRPDRGAPQGQRRCPRCERRLHVQMLGEVELDICGAGCGIWFDAGEVEQLHKASLAAGTATAELAAIFAKVTGMLGGQSWRV